MTDMIREALEHLAAAEDTCGSDKLAKHFAAIRAALYEQLGRELIDAEDE